MDGGEPDIPLYKVIECIGPTNTRVYTVAVYFRGKRLATAMGHSIQQAEMKSAEKALENSRELFPQLDYQKRVITQSIQRQTGKDYFTNNGDKHMSRNNRTIIPDDESNLPKQYRTGGDLSTNCYRTNSDDDKSSNAEKSPKKKRKKSKKTSKKRKDTDKDENRNRNRDRDKALIDLNNKSISSRLPFDDTEDISDISSVESGEIED